MSSNGSNVRPSNAFPRGALDALIATGRLSTVPHMARYITFSSLPATDR
jgi:hypothetical protein